MLLATLKKFTVFVTYPVILIAAVGIYLLLTATSPFSDHHVLYNLESYPDGLFYVNSAQTFLRSHQFFVTYQDIVLRPQIVPVYAGALAAVYAFSPAPGMFYLANILLGVGTVIFVFLSLRLLTQRRLLTILGLAIYLSHIVVVWLPSIPMAENAVLCVFSAALFFVFRYQKKQSLLNLVFAVIGIGSLVTTKYTLIPVAGIFAAFLLLLQFREKNRRGLVLTLSAYVLGGLGFLFAFQKELLSAFTVAHDAHVADTLIGKSVYSLAYIVGNIKFYGAALVFSQGSFLWLHLPIFSFGLFALFLGGVLWLSLRRKSFLAIFLLFIFLAQFPLLLVFYAADLRYILLNIVLFSVGIPLFLSHLQLRKLQIFFIVSLAALCFQIFLQLPLLKMVIATNWLQRSVAWQYEAVKVLNKELPPGSYIVTVLPPLFIDIYSTHQYHVLPLSTQQEFLDKKQFIWGEGINYQDLQQTYKSLLQDGKKVFVTNAYLSSKHEFADEYVQIGEELNETKVADGCLGTCNVYQLELKQ